MDKAESFALKAQTMAELDADLMDVEDEQQQSSYHIEPNKDICIDNLVCNDKAYQDVWLTKEEMHDLLDAFDLNEWVFVPQDDNGGPKCYKFHHKELFLYALNKCISMSWNKTLVESPLFGSSNSCWCCSFKFLMKYLDQRFSYLIGPTAIAMWIPFMPWFRDCIYQYLQKPKPRV